jgi:hypothetical protein
MLEERLNYLSILFIENITKLLSYEDTIREYAAKICRKESTMEMCQAVN